MSFRVRMFAAGAGAAAAASVAVVLAIGLSVPVSAAGAGAGGGAVPRLVSLRLCPGQSGVVCGAVAVPARWGTGGRPTLRVRFDIFRRADRREPAQEPIVGIEGGPGFSSIASAASYLAMIGPLHAHHDLIVMDNRGTGSSGVIDCPALQAYTALARPGRFVADVGACRAQLGQLAGAYGTAAAADDLAYIVGRLGVGQVDVYGDSYGSYAAQVFTLRHPGLVRALVLDGAYDNGYDPLEPEGVAALRRAWTALCRRSPGCGRRSILADIARFAARLRRRPLTGSSRLAPTGSPTSVDLTAPAFAQLVYDASYSAHVFADLPAALRAAAAGRSGPLLRLAANDIAFNSSGPASYFSIGDLEAVSCHDYPAAWPVAGSRAARRAALAHRIAALRDAFSPFPAPVYLSSYVENELVYGCLNWPVSARADAADAPFAATAPYPSTPTLIFDGEFDFSTPLADTRRVVRKWPRSTFVEVANAKHVTAAGDSLRCTSRILQRFVATLAAGDTTCARRMPAISVLPDFPGRLGAAPRATPVAGHPSALAERCAWVAAQTAGDAIGSWFGDGTGDGAAAADLYGGTFQVTGDKLSSAPIRVDLRGARLVPGVPVSGALVWDRRAARVDARVTLRGPGGIRGALRLGWSTGFATWRRAARVTGSCAGSRVDERVRAPWEPQS